MNFKEVFFIKNDQEFSYVKIGEYLIPAFYKNFIIKSEDLKYDFIFEEKKEMRYYSFVKKLQKGDPIAIIKNHKRSPYYKYYLERLKIDHPEYLV